MDGADRTLSVSTLTLYVRAMMVTLLLFGVGVGVFAVRGWK